MNSREGDFPFEFQMVINESRFEYESSLLVDCGWSDLLDTCYLSDRFRGKALLTLIPNEPKRLYG